MQSELRQSQGASTVNAVNLSIDDKLNATDTTIRLQDYQHTEVLTPPGLQLLDYNYGTQAAMSPLKDSEEDEDQTKQSEVILVTQSY